MHSGWVLVLGSWPVDVGLRAGAAVWANIHTYTHPNTDTHSNFDTHAGASGPAC
jgi:hypothetical protein